MSAHSVPTCIDLFCGCGGFTLGLKKAGFRTLAALDFNKEAIAVFRHNFPEVPNVFERDLTTFGPANLGSAIGRHRIDVIVGGPPCQGFSHVRQRDGANSGPRMVEDSRRHLYQEFLKYVAHFKPKVFVMENVLGIRSADSGKYFSRVQSEARAIGYRVHGQIVKAADYGLPQKRQRQLIVGTSLEFHGLFRSGLLKPEFVEREYVTLWEAIGDLPPLMAGGGSEERRYDLERRKRHISRYGSRYLNKVIEVQKANRLTAHRARPHSERDLRDFLRLREGENSHVAMKRGVDFEYPYDKATFHDRYTRQHRHRLCSTIVAHLGKDGLMFIHPTQNRSLTPREAARVQGFPDWFEFPVSRTHQFRLIGNAVPPPVGRAVGNAILKLFDFARPKPGRRRKAVQIPNDQIDASTRVAKIVSCAGQNQLEALSHKDFVEGWSAVFFLLPGLHPDGFWEMGSEIAPANGVTVKAPDGRPLWREYYVQSGWPVALEPILAEAWRRFDHDQLGDDELYCVDAQRRGLLHTLQPMLLGA